MSDYLQVDVEHRLGDLSLRVSCALSAPWTVLFGPSGAGKTSLLRVIGGLTKPDRGRVVLHGRSLVETEHELWVPPGERAIGFVSQRPTLFPHLNVTNNVSFGLFWLNGPSRKERVGQMLDLFQAGQLAKRMPGDLSGGERQRVALARALAPGPRLLLLDEPFTGMDADLKVSILQQLTAWLTKRDVPALYVSHDVAEAFQTAGDVVVMDHGQVKAHGPADVVLAGRREQLLRQLGRGTG
ncbi:MAG: ATP-binding cassette domain-containing protein [Acidobacteriaceae bacterium]